MRVLNAFIQEGSITPRALTAADAQEELAFAVLTGPDDHVAVEVFGTRGAGLHAMSGGRTRSRVFSSSWLPRMRRRAAGSRAEDTSVKISPSHDCLPEPHRGQGTLACSRSVNAPCGDSGYKRGVVAPQVAGALRSPSWNPKRPRAACETTKTL